MTNSSHGHHLHSRFHLLLLLAAAAALSLGLRAHGVSLWYAPAAVIAAHAAAALAFAGIMAWSVRSGPAHGHGQASVHLRAPRFYDALVKVLSLGRESRMRRRTLDLAELRPGDAVLDVGCGTGTLLVAAAARVGTHGTLRGVEPAAEMAAYARRKAARAGVALEVLDSSGDRLPFPDNSFDAAFCTLALHHMPAESRAATLAEMRRVLRPGGRAVIVEFAARKWSLVTLFHGLASHASSTDPVRIATMAREAGFAEAALAPVSRSLGAVVARKAAA